MAVNPTGSEPRIPGPTVTLPPGATVGAGRETSQVNEQGQIVQGMLFPVTMASGTMTSVFVPYGQIGNLETVQRLFTTRLQAIQSITG